VLKEANQVINPKLLELADSKAGGYGRNRGISETIAGRLRKVYSCKDRLNRNWQVEEIDGDHEAEVDAVAVVTEKNAAIREAEVEVTVENATAVAVDEATVVVTRGVVVPSTIVTVNRYVIRRTVDSADQLILIRIIISPQKLSAKVIGVARDDLPVAVKECVCCNAGNFFFFLFSKEAIVINETVSSRLFHSLFAKNDTLVSNLVDALLL